MEIRISGNTVGEIKAQIVDLAQMLLQAEKLHHMDAVPGPRINSNQTAMTGSPLAPPPPPQPDSVFGAAPINDVPKESPAPKAATKKAAKETAPLALAPEPTAKTTLTRDDLADTLRILIASVGANAARALMAEFGYSHLGKIPESDFMSFTTKCNEAMAKAKK